MNVNAGISGTTVWSLGLAAVAFAAIYYPSFDRLARGLASPYAKADLGRRLSAAMVDGLVCISIWLALRSYGPVLYLPLGALYLLVRDSISGRSLGKLCFGLVVIDLHTNQPCGASGSFKRNVLWILPGANVAAAFLETLAIIRDPQGQRLGDRLAQTQVVEGLGVKDLAAEFIRWWRGLFGEIEGSPERRRRIRVTAQCAISNSIEVERSVLR